MSFQDSKKNCFYRSFTNIRTVIYVRCIKRHFQIEFHLSQTHITSLYHKIKIFVCKKFLFTYMKWISVMCISSKNKFIDIEFKIFVEKNVIQNNFFLKNFSKKKISKKTKTKKKILTVRQFLNSEYFFQSNELIKSCFEQLNRIFRSFKILTIMNQKHDVFFLKFLSFFVELIAKILFKFFSNSIFFSNVFFFSVMSLWFINFELSVSFITYFFKFWRLWIIFFTITFVARNE